MIFKIKLEDKAAFLNRMEKTGKEINSNQIKDNKLEGYFEVDVTDPEQLTNVKSILNKSPKINTVKEMKNKLTKDELKEMIHQQLQSILSEKKKTKDKDEKEKLNESSDVLIAGIATLLGVSAAIGIPFIKALFKTPKGEREKLISDFRNAIEKKMSGGM